MKLYITFYNVRVFWKREKRGREEERRGIRKLDTSEKSASKGGGGGAASGRGREKERKKAAGEEREGGRKGGRKCTGEGERVMRGNKT